MTTPQILLLAAAGLSVVISIVTKMPSANRRAARKLLAATDWLDTDSVDGTQVKITGIVKVREHGERFVSPLSENRCVVQRLRVGVRHGRDPRAKIIEKLELVPFIVDDGEDKILVVADHALLDIAPVAQSRSVHPRKNQLLMAMGYESANSMRSDFEETLVELGARVTIVGALAKQPPTAAGAAAYRDSDPPVRILGTKEHPIAIRVERATGVTNEP